MKREKREGGSLLGSHARFGHVLVVSNPCLSPNGFGKAGEAPASKATKVAGEEKDLILLIKKYKVIE